MALKADWAKAKKHFEDKTGGKKPDAGFFHGSGIDNSLDKLDAQLAKKAHSSEIKKAFDEVKTKADEYAAVLVKAAAESSKGADYRARVEELRKALLALVDSGKKSLDDKAREEAAEKEAKARAEEIEKAAAGARATVKASREVIERSLKQMEAERGKIPALEQAIKADPVAKWQSARNGVEAVHRVLNHCNLNIADEAKRAQEAVAKLKTVPADLAATLADLTSKAAKASAMEKDADKKWNDLGAMRGPVEDAQGFLEICADVQQRLADVTKAAGELETLGGPWLEKARAGSKDAALKQKINEMWNREYLASDSAALFVKQQREKLASYGGKKEMLKLAPALEQKRKDFAAALDKIAAQAEAMKARMVELKKYF